MGRNPARTSGLEIRADFGVLRLGLDAVIAVHGCERAMFSALPAIFVGNAQRGLYVPGRLNFSKGERCSRVLAPLTNT
jgi:hypothetical protein